MEPISNASGPHETPSDRGKNLCVQRPSSDLFFRCVEEVSDLSAARIRRYQKFELEKSSPSPLIGTIFYLKEVSALPDLGCFLSHIRSGRKADVVIGYSYCSFGRSRFFFQSTPFALKLRGNFINISMMILAKGSK